ncbi:MAG: flagellar hook-length control protein FliK [bacterium]
MGNAILVQLNSLQKISQVKNSNTEVEIDTNKSVITNKNKDFKVLLDLLNSKKTSSFKIQEEAILPDKENKIINKFVNLLKLPLKEIEARFKKMSSEDIEGIEQVLSLPTIELFSKVNKILQKKSFFINDFNNFKKKVSNIKITLHENYKDLSSVQQFKNENKGNIEILNNIEHSDSLPRNNDFSLAKVSQAITESEHDKEKLNIENDKLLREDGLTLDKESDKLNKSSIKNIKQHTMKNKKNTIINSLKYNELKKQNIFSVEKNDELIKKDVRNIFSSFTKVNDLEKKGDLQLHKTKSSIKIKSNEHVSLNTKETIDNVKNEKNTAKQEEKKENLSFKRNLNNYTSEAEQKNVSIKNNDSFLQSQENSTLEMTNVNEVIEKITDQMKLHTNGNNKRFEIQLEPEHLGKVKVNLSSDENGILIKLTVESMQVKNHLEQNLPSLRSNLFRQDVNLNNIDIEVNEQSFSFEHQGQQQNQERAQHQFEQETKNFTNVNPENLDELVNMDETTRALYSRWLHYNRAHMDFLA